jgi:hypothetical protein
MIKLKRLTTLRSRDQQAQVQLQSFAHLVSIYRVFGGGLAIEGP